MLALLRSHRKVCVCRQGSRQMQVRSLKRRKRDIETNNDVNEGEMTRSTHTDTSLNVESQVKNSVKPFGLQSYNSEENKQFLNLGFLQDLGTGLWLNYWKRLPYFYYKIIYLSQISGIESLVPRVLSLTKKHTHTHNYLK